MSTVLNANTVDVTLTDDEIVALLQAVRSLGKDLGSVHPRYRLNVRLAESDLRKALGLLSDAAAVEVLPYGEDGPAREPFTSGPRSFRGLDSGLM